MEEKNNSKNYIKTMESSNTKKRKLAAIMFTDIAGFTKLSSSDEEKAFALVELQRELLKPVVEEHDGEWLKEMGDGLLLSFPSSKQAVNCAIKIQHVTKDIDGLNLRIGIHQGDILFSGNDVFGDDVNIAARMEPFSAVGGIAISNKVNDDISSSPEITTKFISQPMFKGVRQEVKVYCITSHGLPETDITKVTAKLEKDVSRLGKNQRYIIAALVVLFVAVIGLYFYNPGKSEIPSVAILLMENLGNEEDQFWMRGITEDLIVKVASSGEVKVSSIREVLNLAEDASLEDIAAKLKVKYLFTSSMHKQEDSFSLRCQLVETESGVSKYAKKWNVPLDSSPVIVGDIASNILTALGITAAEEISRVPTINTQAYEYYLKGKYKFHTRENKEDLEIARGLLERAIELDENLLKAQDQLGYSYFVVGDDDKALEIFRKANLKAEELGDKGIQASMLCNFGNIYYGKGKYDEAMDYYKKCADLLQTFRYGKLNSAVQANIGLIYHERLDYDRALKYYNKAIDMCIEADDQKSIGMNYINLGALYSDMGDVDKCLDVSFKAKEIFEEADDKYLQTYILHTIGSNYQRKKDYELSEEFYRKALGLKEQMGNREEIAFTLGGLGLLYTEIYDFDTAESLLDSAYNMQMSIDDRVGILTTNLYLGDLYYASGKYKSALVHFEEAYKAAIVYAYPEDLIFASRGLGATYLQLEDYQKADSLLSISLAFQSDTDLGEHNEKLGNISLAQSLLARKMLNQEVKLDSLISRVKGSESNDFELQYRLYQLTGEKSYLEKSIKFIDEKADYDRIGDNIYTVPMVKRIASEAKKAL
ncbi:MAG: hypothetical protein SCALA702_19700 [Melioribacteraceae bacterium]|nr:MAG: hypothetical protein SCALA702_19700 [Melioribacteraceae bacterium]